MLAPRGSILYTRAGQLSPWLEVDLMLKSIAVVVGSYLLSVALVMASDPLLSRLFPGDFVGGRVPSNNALLAIICAWICARFAPGRAARHVLWFFILGEAMGIGAIIPNWNKGWPHWYWLSWLLTWPVSCWVGMLLARPRRGTSLQVQP
jgi:hypothetical protein